jgi:ABC-2 type transport system permease protein
MMFLTLLKIRMHAAYASLFKGTLQKKKKRNPIVTVLIALLAVYVFAAVIALFGMMFNMICKGFCEAGLDWLYLALIALVTFVVSFIVSIFTAQAELFEAKDNDLLLSMPIRPRTILLSRIGIMLLYDYLLLILILIPAWFLYCRYGNVTAAGAICFFLGMLAVPFLAEAFACLFGWLIALITLRMKHRNLLTVVFSLAFILLYVFGYTKFMSAAAANAAWLTGSSAAIAALVRRYILPFWWLGTASAGGNPVWLPVFLAFTAACFSAVYAVLSASFMKIATMKRGAARSEYREGAVKVSSIRRVLLRKELGRFFSSANYMLNSAIGLVFMLLLGGAAVVKGSALLTVLSAVPGAAELLKNLGTGVILAMCMMLSMTFISAPSVSLEGSSLWIVQSIPVGGELVLQAKAACQIAVCVPCIAVTALALNIALPMSLPLRVMLFITPTVYCAFIAYTGLLLGLKYARFDWADEIVVIKQGIAVLLTMLLGFASFLACAGLCLGLSRIFPAELSVAIVTLLLAGAALGMHRYLGSAGAARFAALH